MMNPGSDTASCGGIRVLALHPLIRRTYSAERSVSRLTAAVSRVLRACRVENFVFRDIFRHSRNIYFVPDVQRPSSHDFWYDEVG